MLGAFNSRGLVFAFNCTVAALLALYIGFSFGLTNPWWAALTVFITSQPMAAASGAVVARALYRIAGTVAGVAAALVVLPWLANTPELLIAAVAAWVAVCLYVSLLHRTPRGYAFMLAGYTLAFVGLPLIGDPSGIFDTAVARCEEIGIGAVCAALMHCLVFPRSVHAALHAKVDASVKDARGWIANALSPDATAASERSARRRLAADLTELDALAAVMRHEAGSHAAAPRIVLALEHRLAALLPLLTGVEDRLEALAKDAAIGEGLSRHLAEVRQWVEQATGGDDRRADLLIEAGRRVSDDAAGASPWGEVLVASLVQRLEELVRAWDDALQLIHLLRHPDHAPNERARAILADETSGRDLHVDHGLAAYYAFAAAIAVILTAVVAAATGWPQGSTAVGIAAAGSSVFAFADDPRPLQRTFIVWTFVSIAVAALYGFAILPAVDGFVALTLALLPLFFGTALYLATPRYWLPALAFALVSQTLIALQSAHAADFITFTTVSLASVSGAMVALIVTSLIRVIGAETSSWRILRAGWRDLGALAAGGQAIATTPWVSRMLDRVALLLPRLAAAAGVERLRKADALNDLRVGVNVAELRELALGSNQGASISIDQALRGVAQHFESQRRDRHLAPDASLLRAIDKLIDQLFQLDVRDTRRRGLVAAAGLRRGLFPDAPPYRPEESAT
jgi:uncharacterized membrane protein YccC